MNRVEPKTIESLLHSASLLESEHAFWLGDTAIIKVGMHLSHFDRPVCPFLIRRDYLFYSESAFGDADKSGPLVEQIIDYSSSLESVYFQAQNEFWGPYSVKSIRSYHYVPDTPVFANYPVIELQLSNCCDEEVYLAASGGRAWYGVGDYDCGQFFNCSEQEIVRSLESSALDHQGLGFEHMSDGRWINLFRKDNFCSISYGTKGEKRFFTTWKSGADRHSHTYAVDTGPIFAKSFIPLVEAKEKLERLLANQSLEGWVPSDYPVLIEGKEEYLWRDDVKLDG